MSHEPMPPMIYDLLVRQNPDFAQWLYNLRSNIADLSFGSVTDGRLAWVTTEGEITTKDLVDLIAASGNLLGVADDSSGGVTLSLSDLVLLITGTSNEITVTDDGDGSVTLSLPKLSYSNDRMYLTNVSTARAIDRTSDVITSTVTVSDSNTETTIFTGVIAANALKAGNVLKVIAHGCISNASASDDITLRGYIGSTLLGEFNPTIGNVTDDHWSLESILVVRSVGTSGSIAWDVHMDIGGNSSQGNDISTVNTTTAENFTITVQWDSADPDNTINLGLGFLEWKN